MNRPPSIEVLGGIPGSINFLVADDHRGRFFIIQGVKSDTLLRLISVRDGDGKALYSEKVGSMIEIKMPHDGIVGPLKISLAVNGQSHYLPEIFCPAKVEKPQKRERIIFD